MKQPPRAGQICVEAAAEPRARPTARPHGIGVVAVLLGFLAFGIGSGGAAAAPAVEVAPVTFAHPDEVVRGEGFLVLADRRIFAVMAFLNAVGYDREAEGQAMHPVRIRVRAMVEKNLAASADELRSWKQLYKEKGLATFHYMDFVLSFCADYPFRRVRPDSELTYPQTERKLRDLPDLLNRFWVAAGLEDVWREVEPDYVAEIHKYDFDRMKRKLSFTWEYLRMTRRDSDILVSVPNLLEAHYQSIASGYENYYYSVESPGSHSYDLNIHEYLHSVVNPLVIASYRKNKKTLQDYYKAGKDGPYAKTYQNPETFAYECLVRALDHRLRVKLGGSPDLEKKIEEATTDISAKGLTLTRPFYDLLAEYEKSGEAFDVHLPTMLAHLPKYGASR